MYNKYKGLIGFVAPSIMVATFFILRLAKISPIIGSTWGFFSLSDVAMPLTGVLGLGFGICVAIARMSYKAFVLGAPLSSVVYYLPGLCAAGSWARKGPLFRLLVPLVCIVLFVAHPTGFAAAPYSLYWLIPVGIYFLDSKSIFLQSLSSTFVAHAVGSILWLYSFDMSAQMWLGLIPLVAVERLFFASAMTVIYTGAFECKRIIVSKVFSFSKFA
jgi:hypothetical protein